MFNLHVYMTHTFVEKATYPKTERIALNTVKQEWYILLLEWYI